MQSSSAGALMRVVSCLAIGTGIPHVSTAQVAQPGEIDPSGHVYTQIVARVGELGSNSPAIPGLAVYVVSEDGRRLTLRTNLGGTAATWLARARYRLVTPEPFQLQGRLYTWDTIVAVRPGMGPIRLQVANAKSTLVPIVTWRPGDASSGPTTQDGRIVRTITSGGVSVSASILRSDDLMWTDVTITNRSQRNVAVDPAEFTLTELSPKQGQLPNVRSTDISSAVARKAKIDLNRSLTTNTISPGQGVTGAVFFARDKDAREVMLRVPLSGVTFDVPFSIR